MSTRPTITTLKLQLDNQDQILMEIKNRLSFGGEFVTRDSYDALQQEINDLKKEIDRLREFKTWAYRTIIGSMVSGGLSFFLTIANVLVTIFVFGHR